MTQLLITCDFILPYNDHFKLCFDELKSNSLKFFLRSLKVKLRGLKNPKIKTKVAKFKFAKVAKFKFRRKLWSDKYYL